MWYMNHNTNQKCMITLNMQQCHTYLRGKQQLFNWIVSQNARKWWEFGKEIMGHVDKQAVLRSERNNLKLKRKKSLFCSHLNKINHHHCGKLKWALWQQELEVVSLPISMNQEAESSGGSHSTILSLHSPGPQPMERSYQQFRDVFSCHCVD